MKDISILHLKHLVLLGVLESILNREDVIGTRGPDSDCCNIINAHTVQLSDRLNVSCYREKLAKMAGGALLCVTKRKEKKKLSNANLHSFYRFIQASSTSV